jgi:hypothetical protein
VPRTPLLCHHHPLHCPHPSFFAPSPHGSPASSTVELRSQTLFWSPALHAASGCSAERLTGFDLAKGRKEASPYRGAGYSNWLTASWKAGHLVLLPKPIPAGTGSCELVHLGLSTLGKKVKLSIIPDKVSVGGVQSAESKSRSERRAVDPSFSEASKSLADQFAMRGCAVYQTEISQLFQSIDLAADSHAVVQLAASKEESPRGPRALPTKTSRSALQVLELDRAFPSSCARAEQEIKTGQSVSSARICSDSQACHSNDLDSQPLLRT